MSNTQFDQLKDHIEPLLAAAYRLCGDLNNAQDLTQETLMSALLAMERGRTIETLSGYLHTVLRGKYYDMLRRKYNRPTVTVDCYDDGEALQLADPDADFVAQIAQDEAKKERAESCRREVAYLADTYRRVIALHYFHGKSVKEIAATLGIPEGTVKSRLDFGRKLIKKGLTEMEHYTENSYMPQHLHVCNSGRFGNNEEPMSLVEDDVLAQNLLILAYDKPMTVPELSRAIGVATAYVEPVIRKLVDGELMRRTGDGKVYTDFIIYHQSDYSKYIHQAEALVDAHLDAYTTPVKQAIAELKQTDFYSERLERFMLIQIASFGQFNSIESIREKPQVFPQRPNGGAWIAFGTIRPENYVIPEDRRGREEYMLAGRRLTLIDRYLDGKNLWLFNFESALDPNCSRKFGGYGYDRIQDIEYDMLKLFYLIENEIDPASVGFDAKILQSIPLLCERGFLESEGGKLRLAIPRLTHAQDEVFAAIWRRAADAFADAIRAPLAEYCMTHRKEIPPHLDSVPDQKRTMPYEPAPMMFVFETIKKGLHPRDLGACPETFCVFD
ncbi:MAG: RNA polymerase sigma factor [Clostridia bacterium]|nr:RNA polymerase sigma factor [Clostridia bacterium]